MDTTVPSPGCIENMLDSPVSPVMTLSKVVNIDAITKALPPSAAVMEGPVAACRGSKLIDTTVDGTTTDRPAPLV